MSENTVYLSTQAYNNLYSENTKFRLLFERIWDQIDLDHGQILFNDEHLNILLKSIFPTRYEKELSKLIQDEKEKINDDNVTERS